MGKTRVGNSSEYSVISHFFIYSYPTLALYLLGKMEGLLLNQVVHIIKTLPIKQ